MVSRETVVVYKCDRCGKRMDSPYANFTLKRNNVVLKEEIDFVNKDLCADCFDKIASLMDDSEAMIVTTSSRVVKQLVKNYTPFTINCGDTISAKQVATKTTNNSLGKYLDMTGV